MRGNRTSRTVTIISVLVIIVSVVFGVNSIVGLASNSFDNSGKYTAGGATIEDPVRNLDIEWVSGTVTFEYHKENTVVLSEKSNKTISSDKQMRWCLDGDTLRIRFAKSGFSLFSFGSTLDKELTVTLPEDIELGEVSIDATSGTLDIPSLEAEKLKLDITSGEILAVTNAQTIVCDATSGSIDLSVPKEVKEISTDITSGIVNIVAAGADKIKCGSTSGDIFVAVDSIGTIDVEATSGSVTLSLPEEPGFTADLDVTSGDIEYDLPLAKKGDGYVCGDGSGTVKVDTTSGDIRIVAR